MSIQLKSRVAVLPGTRVARPRLAGVTASITSMGQRGNQLYVRIYLPEELFAADSTTLFVHGPPDRLAISSAAPAAAAIPVTLHRRYSASTNRRAIVLNVRHFTDDPIAGPVRAMAIPWRRGGTDLVVDITPVFARLG